MKTAALVLLLLSGSVLAKDDGRWAQADPELRKWFKEQKVPGGPGVGTPCCDVSDGVWAEEDIKEGRYRVRFVTTQGTAVDWTEVPEETVIKGPNKWGRAVVWYWYDNARPKIRCFIPGAGI